jgi:hypothetical protein
MSHLKIFIQLSAVVILISALLSCGDDNGDSTNTTRKVFGSGTIIQETRDVIGAKGVNMDIVANMTIEQGLPEELILNTDDNLMAFILSSVQEETLVISNEPGIDLEPSQDIEVLLRLEDIDNIIHSGVGDITVPDLTQTQIDITLSSVGDIDISNLDGTTLDVMINGVGDVSIAGQVENQTVELISLGNYEAENLVSETADVEISSIGSATVQVSTTLNAHITGSGSVHYIGNPVVNRTGNGTGKVTQLSP